MTAPIKPPAVDDVEIYWGSPPPERSPRCAYWVEQIEKGWSPNRRIGQMGYYSSAEWFGVYIWEYLNVISPLLMRQWEERQEKRDDSAAKQVETHMDSAPGRGGPG